MKKAVLITVITILLIIILVLSMKLSNINEEIDLLHENVQVEGTGAILYDLSNIPEKREYGNKIWVPNDVVYVRTVSMYATTFASLKSVDVLKKEVEKILEEHYELVDGTYYDSENDSTILDYSIEEGKIMNYIIYEY